MQASVSCCVRRSRSRDLGLERGLLLGLLALGALVPSLGRASDIFVNSLADTDLNDANCTLREAILNANADAPISPECVSGNGLDTIRFELSGTIVLGAVLPDAVDFDGLTIDGLRTPGPNITISGDVNGNGINDGNDVSIFRAAGGPFAVRNLTVANAGGMDPEDGFGIRAASTSLSVDSSAFIGNGSSAIAAATSTLVITDSTFTGNGNLSTDSLLGCHAVEMETAAGVISRCQFSKNVTAALGGVQPDFSCAAVVLRGGTLLIADSAFNENGNNQVGSSSQGGAIFNMGGGSLVVLDSMFIGNLARTGGAILSSGGHTRVARCKFSDNNADANGPAVDGQPEDGGAMRVSLGRVTIDESLFTGNFAGSSGGAIAAALSQTIITNSTFSDNIAEGKNPSPEIGGGGAIQHLGTGLSITDSTFSGNVAPNGGVLLSIDTAVDITHSTFSENIASGTSLLPLFGPKGGGVIYNVGGITVTDSAFLDNDARHPDSLGGAILNILGGYFLSNSTMAGNSAMRGAGAIYSERTQGFVSNSTFSGNSTPGNGGAIENSDLSHSIVTNTTFSGNSAGLGGALYVRETSAIELQNTIVASSIMGGHCFEEDANSVFIDRGNNLEDTDTCGFSALNGSKPSTPAGLDPAGLKDNGGTTRTIALLATSMAIDTGDPNACSDSLFVNNLDQRGASRPVDGPDADAIATCDIGAFEAGTTTLDAISGITILEDAPAQTVNLSGITLGHGSGTNLSVTATSSNPSLIPDPSVSYTNSAATGSLSFTSVSIQNGTADITVKVQTMDASPGTLGSFSRTFTVTVTPVNDAPTLDAISDPAAIVEDAPAQSVNLSGISAGPANESAQTLSVTATSSNPGLIPVPTFTSTGPTTGTLSYTPGANQYGTALITVTVKDNGGTANAGLDSFVRAFMVTVTAVNDAPTLAAIPDPAALAQNSGPQTVNLTGINPGSNETQLLTVTAASSNLALIPNLSVLLIRANSTGTLTFTPAVNQSGTAVITVTVMDDGGTANGGINTFSRSFTVTVPDPVPQDSQAGRLLLLFSALLFGVRWRRSRHKPFDAAPEPPEALASG